MPSTVLGVEGGRETVPIFRSSQYNGESDTKQPCNMVNAVREVSKC